jgi:hypothetical protein
MGSAGITSSLFSLRARPVSIVRRAFVARSAPFPRPSRFQLVQHTVIGPVPLTLTIKAPPLGTPHAPPEGVPTSLIFAACWLPAKVGQPTPSSNALATKAVQTLSL